MKEILFFNTFARQNCQKYSYLCAIKIRQGVLCAALHCLVVMLTGLVCEDCRPAFFERLMAKGIKIIIIFNKL